MDYASDIDSDGVPVRRQRRGGFSFLVIATGTVCLAAAWIVAATDPYSELAQRVLEVRSEGGPIDEESVPLFELALDPPKADPAAVAATWRVPAGGDTFAGSDVTFAGSDAAVLHAGPPPVRYAAAMRREPPTVGPHVMPGERPVVPPAQFIGPRLPGGPEGEQALAMTRSERRAVQLRLSLAGHDAGTPDGIFGQRTREAIASFQHAAGLEESGYLNAPVLAWLHQATEQAYEKWQVAEAARRRARQASRSSVAAAPVPEPREEAAEGGCRRASDGSVIGHQSLGCDLRGLGESFGRMFSGKLPEGQEDVSLAPLVSADR